MKSSFALRTYKFGIYEHCVLFCCFHVLSLPASLYYYLYMNISFMSLLSEYTVHVLTSTPFFLIIIIIVIEHPFVDVNGNSFLSTVSDFLFCIN